MTESGRDFQLARAGTHFLRDRERRDNILASLIARHSLKAPRHESPDSYVAYVVAGATASRDRVDADQRSSFAARFVWPTLPHAPAAAGPPTVLDATFLPEALSKHERTDGNLGADNSRIRGNV